MPEKKTMERARSAKRAGKAPSTQAGAFVKEEIDHVREGKHGVKSAKQAVAIGLSKARRAGVDMKPPAKGKTSTATRKKAEKDYEAGHKPASKRAKSTKSASTETKAKRSRTTTAGLKRESGEGASHRAMSKQSHSAASRRSASSRSAAAKKAARTKGATGRSAAAKKAAHTRAARAHH
jgi:hypothetical protein